MDYQQFFQQEENRYRIRSHSFKVFILTSEKSPEILQHFSDMSDIMRFSLFNVLLFNLRRSIQLILIKDSLPLITVGAVGTATFLHHLNLSPPQSNGTVLGNVRIVGK